MDDVKQIPDRLYFRIGDVADIAGVKPYVLRYWETEFSAINPEKSPTGQRVYTRSDVENILLIKHLLYDERYSIEGARKRIKELRKEGGLKTAVKTGNVLRTESYNPDKLRAALSELRETIEKSGNDVFTL